MVGELGCDRGEHARIVVNHEADSELGLGSLDRSLLQILVQRDGRAGAALRDMAGFGHDVSDNRGGRRT